MERKKCVRSLLTSSFFQRINVRIKVEGETLQTHSFTHTFTRFDCHFVALPFVFTSPSLFCPLSPLLLHSLFPFPYPYPFPPPPISLPLTFFSFSPSPLTEHVFLSPHGSVDKTLSVCKTDSVKDVRTPFLSLFLSLLSPFYVCMSVCLCVNR